MSAFSVGLSPLGGTAGVWGGQQATPGFTTLTTTIALIRDQMITVVESLTPASFASSKFKAERSYYNFEEWANDHANTCLRRFCVINVGQDPPEVTDHQVEYLRADFLVQVAYPKRLPTSAGTDGLRDLRDLMREDADLIDDYIGAVGGARGNYVSGQCGSVKTSHELREDEAVLFSELNFEVYFNRSVA